MIYFIAMSNKEYVILGKAVLFAPFTPCFLKAWIFSRQNTMVNLPP